MSEFPAFNFPLDKWIDAFVDWLTVGWRFEFFRAISGVVLWGLVRIDRFLHWLPPGAFIVILAVLAWRLGEGQRTRRELVIVLAESVSVGLGLILVSFAQNQEVTNAAPLTILAVIGYVLLALAAVIVLGFWIVAHRRPGLAELAVAGPLFIGAVGLWEEAMTTLAVVGMATLIAILIALPTGVVMAKSDRMEAIIRPTLDAMQTMPSFVYLVPALMLFGLGKVPAVIATLIYAVPPGIRLTNLGIRLVPKELLEAAEAFGTTPRQMLFKVQLPVAMPTIMTGVNQVIMASLSMVVIASLVGASGLGIEVLHGIARLRVGQGFNGGISIVLLAVVIDRITQNLGGGRKGAKIEE
jgi:glycine betaine/proline transport system permease protein